MRARSSPTIKIEAVRVLLPAEREGSEAVVVAVVSCEPLKTSPSSKGVFHATLRRHVRRKQRLPFDKGGLQEVWSGLRSAFPSPS